MKHSFKRNHFSLLIRHVIFLTAQILLGHQYLWNDILDGTFSNVNQSIIKCSLIFTFFFYPILHLLHKATVNVNCYIIYCYSGWGERLVNIFSLYQNIPDVLSFDDHDDDSIGCVHGIRVLSLAWLVLGNSFLYAALSITSAPVTGKSWNLFWI